MDAVSPIPVMKPWLGSDEAAAATEAILSGWVSQGPRVAKFERAVGSRLHAPHAIATTSCTTGLHLALVVAGLGPGDEVVVPSLSFIASTNAVRYVGASPVFCDVDPATQNITADTVAAVVTPRTRAVMVVHQCGIPADLGPLRALCRRNSLVLIEDAACAIGSTYKGSPVGSGSELVAFSFHPRKIITTGEGGMILTDNDSWAERLRSLRDHGTSRDAFKRHLDATKALETYAEVGYNYRMTDIQAAIGLVQLGRLEEIVGRRRMLAQRYQSAFSDMAGVAMATDPPYGTTNFQAFWFLLPEDFPCSRDELMADMESAGISPRRGVMAAHLEVPYHETPHAPLPVTEMLTHRSLVLPMYHEMTESDQDRVIDVVRRAAHVPA